MVGNRPTENPEAAMKAREGETNLSEKAQQVNNICSAEITPELRASGVMVACNEIMSGEMADDNPEFPQILADLEAQRNKALNSVDQNPLYPSQEITKPELIG